MNTRSIQTSRGARVRVLDYGPAGGEPLVFLHGLSGLLDDSTFFDLLAQRHHVFVPEMPGYGESSGEELLEDMLDFALHGWDVVVSLGPQRASSGPGRAFDGWHACGRDGVPRA